MVAFGGLIPNGSTLPGCSGAFALPTSEAGNDYAGDTTCDPTKENNTLICHADCPLDGKSLTLSVPSDNDSNVDHIPHKDHLK